MRKFLATCLILALALPVAAQTTRVVQGNGYVVITGESGACLFGSGVTAPPVGFCQEGAPFYRTDTKTWYSYQSGAWATTPLVIPSPTITSPTITSPTITAPVITGIVTDPTTTAGVGAGASGITTTENGSGAVHRTTFTFASYSLAVTDTGGANGGQGSVKIYDFPEGYLLLLGTTCNLTTARVSTGLATTAAMVWSLGSATAGAGDATLTSTEADFIASYAGSLTSGAGVFTKTGTGTFTAFDGHTTPIDLFFNTAVPDAGISATDAVTLTGTCVVLWANQGDI